MAAKCPHCDSVIKRLKIENMTSSSSAGQSWNIIAYTCPLCMKIITAGIDPIAIMTDTVNAINER